jgi:hypothetical protein
LASEPPSQRISLRSAPADSYVLTRGGIGATTASQPLMMSGVPSVTRFVDSKMPSMPRLSSTPRISTRVGSPGRQPGAGASPLMSARGRQQTPVAIGAAVPQWQGDSPVKGIAFSGGSLSTRPVAGPPADQRSTIAVTPAASKLNGAIGGSLTLPMNRGGGSLSGARTVPGAGTGGSLQTPVWSQMSPQLSMSEVKPLSGSTLASNYLSTPRVAARQTTPAPASPRHARQQSPSAPIRTVEALPAPEPGQMPAWVLPGSLKPQTVTRSEFPVAGTVREVPPAGTVRGGTPARVLSAGRPRTSEYQFVGGVSRTPPSVTTGITTLPFTPR